MSAGAPPIRVINLARRPDRLAWITDQLDRLGLAFERFDAIDAATADPALLARMFPKKGPLGVMAAGDMCCTLSHRAIWAEMVAARTPVCVVLEDDMRLSDDFAEIAGRVDWLPEDAAFVKLERFGNARHRVLLGPETGAAGRGRRLHPLLSKNAGAGAYIVTLRGAEAALAATEQMALPVDHILFNPNNSRLAARLRPLQMAPACAEQARDAVTTDDIHASRLAVRPSGPPYWWRETIRGWYEIRRTPLQLLQAAFGGARLAKVDYRA